MKKVLFVVAFFAGMSVTATAQKAPKAQNAPKASAVVAESSAPVAAEAAVAELVAPEAAELREVPVYDANGNQSGTKMVQIDKNGKPVAAPETREAQRAKKLEAEAAKPAGKN